MRESFTGRIVWRNWSLDLFKRRRGDWVKKIQGVSSETVVPGSEKSKPSDARGKGGKMGAGNPNKAGGGGGKTAIEMARERFAEGKRAKENGGVRMAGVRGNKVEKSKGKGARETGITA